MAMKKKPMKKAVKTTAKKSAKIATKAKPAKKAAPVKKGKVAAKKPVKKLAKKPAAKPVVASKSKVVAKKVMKPGGDSELKASLVELIRVTSAELPDDVQKVILEALAREEKNTTAEYAMNIINANIDLAKKKSQPLCQDTGTVLFYVYHPVGFNQSKFTKLIEGAVVEATKKGFLRQNSVDSLTGENSGVNLGPGHPSIHFHEHNGTSVKVKLMLKGGGCENVGAQYSLPHTALGAGRDLDGVRKVILDAVHKAQGKGCGPGVLGVCIGGDRGAGYIESKEQLLRRLDDTNSIASLAELEGEEC